MLGTRSLETLSHAECIDLLAAAQVGRVVFTMGALPAVIPVTFILRDDAILTRTAADTRLAKAANGSVLAFQIDELDPVTRTGWSVLVTGVAELVTDTAEREKVDGLLQPWAPGQRDVFIRVPLTMVSGRRIVAEVAEPSPNGSSG
jgi:nitroimidazol reductase NimA-like FMN-containing flavoprotein (pyridoxamine 5'-phosphate oxidase superfamily)